MRNFNASFLFLLPTLFLFCLSAARDTLTSSQSLADGQTLVSARASFTLGFFSPLESNNRYVGIWYNKVPAQTVVWVANRKSPITGSTGVLTLSANGSLFITASNSTALIWSSAATGSTIINPVAQLLDTGNFVMREEADIKTEGLAWQSFDYPTDTLLPGMKLGWDLPTGLERRLTSWASISDPSPGAYSASIDIRGDPQLVLSRGPDWVWRGGPWDGRQFSGVPQMKSFQVFNYAFVNNKDEIYYVYQLANKSIITRLTVVSGGTLQRMVWIDPAHAWSTYWYWPKDQCDNMLSCGPYGVCYVNDSPPCACLPGFVPKLPAEWALRDGSGGCIRRTALDCRNRTDGFAVVSAVKLPDTSRTTVDMSVGLDECRARCLSNCSCTAYASAAISDEAKGCIIWTDDITDMRAYTDNSGQDLYLRLSAKDLDSSTEKPQKKKGPITLIVLGIVLGVLLLLLCGCFVWRIIKGRKASTHSSDETNNGENGMKNIREKDIELPILDFRTIVAATDNFAIQNKIGEGGFGPVYKGKLEDGEDIAVKRLATTSVQGLDEFKNEAILIAKLQHRNLVRLQGCCIEGEERMLIYEYMHNKSLDAFLFDEEKRMSLDWQARSHIIMGIARGLLYLHEDSRFRVIHRDLKASNILLDKEMNPKISDFGIARIFGGDDIQANTHKVIGTFGYMSPEYAMDGIFSVKSDVYSFGVLVLETISGKKNQGVFASLPQLNLLGHAWTLWNDGKGLELVDESMNYSFPMDEVLRFIIVGLLCVQQRPEDRPTMSSVVQMLGSDDVSLPHPKRPGFVAANALYKANSAFITQVACTMNHMTVSTISGR